MKFYSKAILLSPSTDGGAETSFNLPTGIKNASACTQVLNGKLYLTITWAEPPSEPCLEKDK